MQIEKKHEQIDAGGGFLQYLKKIGERVVGYELPWSQDAHIPLQHVNPFPTE